MVRQLGMSQDAVYTSIRKWTDLGFIEKNKFNFSVTANTDAYGDGDNYYTINEEAIENYFQTNERVNKLKNSPKENIPNDLETAFCIFNPVDNMVVGRDARKAVIYRAIKDMRVSGYTVTTSLLMTRTGFGERAARKALKELSKFNFISVESRVSKRTFTRVNEFGKVYIPRIEYFVYNVTSKFVKIRQHFEALWEDFINFGLKAFTHTYKLLVFSSSGL